MRSSARLSSLAIALLASLAVLLPSGVASAQAPSVCPATFQVLHDDNIGSLRLAAGPYAVTVRGNLSCAEASDLLREFLEDFRGRLPNGWRVDPDAASFSRGTANFGFSVALASAPSGGGGGRHPTSGARCPGTFRVLHDDRIGSFRVPAGRYRITRLSTRLSCAKSSFLLARFLQDFDGVLPRPWSLDAATGTFRSGAGTVGFRIKPFSGTPVPTGGGSGVHPRNADRCPGTFQVLNSTRIGKLRLQRGRYRITLLDAGSLTCADASRRFTAFLEDFDGMLPRPWVLDVDTATFTRGRQSDVGFRVKPVRG